MDNTTAERLIEQITAGKPENTGHWDLEDWATPRPDDADETSNDGSDQ